MILTAKIMGSAVGLPTTLDGRYLVEYDPSRDGVDPHGRPMTAHIETTLNREDAKKFHDAWDFHSVYNQFDRRNPIRPDGKANRPLTYFNILLERYDV